MINWVLKYWTSNIWDEIQSLAVRQHLNSCDVYIDRDGLNDYKWEDIRMIINWWFNPKNVHLPLSDNISPKFIWYHISNREDWNNPLLSHKALTYYKKYWSIGCRDQETCDILNKKWVDAYLSLCPTITFPKRETTIENKKVFIVDTDIFLHIPKHLKKNSEYISHKIPSWYDFKKKFDIAEDLLNKYKKEAKLVITSRLHCALPCIAMGIPVVVFCDPNDKRMQLVKQFIKINPYIHFDHNMRNLVKLNFSIKYPFIKVKYLSWTNIFWIFYTLIRKLYYNITFYFRNINRNWEVVDIEDKKKKIINSIQKYMNT